MRTFVSSLEDVKSQFEQEKGEFALFSCFRPEDSTRLWDVIVSAPWAPRHDETVLRSLITALDKTMLPEDRRAIGAVVVVEPSDEDVQRLNDRFCDPSEPQEIRGEEYFGYVVDVGYVLASLDYWRFLKAAFPPKAEFAFATREGDLLIRVSWKLDNDPARRNKRSRIIMIRISREVLEDYIYIDDAPQRGIYERKLAAYLRERLRHFNPEHAEPAFKGPPVEDWPVTSVLFQRPAALG